MTQSYKRVPITFIVPVHYHGEISAYAKVDAADYPIVANYRWNLMKKESLQYARTYEKRDGQKLEPYMHRIILGLPPGRIPEVDHKDGDGLNNRRNNLRASTHAENGQNWHSHKDSSSQYRGVSWEARRRRWRARIRLGGKIVVDKCFRDEHEAGKFIQQERQRLMPYAIEDVNGYPEDPCVHVKLYQVTQLPLFRAS